MRNKKCSKCNKIKPVEEFYKSKAKDGLCAQCKSCICFQRISGVFLLQNLIKAVLYALGYKKCPKCNEAKSIKEFCKAKQTKDGLNGWCKKCVKKSQQSERGKINKRKADQKYYKSERGIAANKKYKQSEKGRRTQEIWNHSEKAKIAQRVWSQSERGKEVRMKIKIKYYKKYPGQIRREDPLYIQWAFDVKKNAGFKSEVSDKNKNLHSHHIFSWKDFPGLRYCLENGICLTDEEHRAYHKKIGYKKVEIGINECIYAMIFKCQPIKKRSIKSV